MTVAVVLSSAALASPPAASASLVWAGPLKVSNESIMSGVSCPSAHECVALAGDGQVWTFDPASHGAPAPEQLKGVALASRAFSCPAAHLCVLYQQGVGNNSRVTFDPTSPCELGEPVFGEEEARCEKEVAIDEAPGCVEEAFCEESLDVGSIGDTMACPSATQCTVTGGFGEELTFDPSAPGGHEPVVVDNTKAPPGGNAFEAISCPASTECTAVDMAGNEVTFDPQSPGSPKQAPLGFPTGEKEELSPVTAVSCPSIAQCTAVSADGEEVTFNPLAPGSPAPVTLAEHGAFWGIACPTTGQCTAVGFESDAPPRMSATTFAPGAPLGADETTISTDEELGNAIDVQCPLTTLCVAVAEAYAAFVGQTPGPPQNTSPPKISGTAEAGQTLTEEHGSWTNGPTSYSYQWESCNEAGGECTPIEGATSQTYLLAPEDVGHTIQVQEYASNEAGTGGPATSQDTGVVQPESSGGGPSPDEQGGAPNESERPTTCSCGKPVNTATGVFWHSFTDAHVPGLGVPLDFSRTYTSSAATVAGPLGYGWTHSYEMRLSFDAKGNATVAQEDAAAVSFTAKAGSYQAAPGVLATLVKNGDGTYTFKRNSTNEQFVFSSSGKLTSEIDRHGYETQLTYNGSGELTKVTDQAGRALTLAYAGGHLTSVTDPLGHVTTFGYDPAGNLAKTTDPLGRTWSFTYDAKHLLLTMTDPNGGVAKSTYDGSGRVIKQVDPAGRVLVFAYSGDNRTAAGGTTTVTDPRGLQTQYHYQSEELVAETAAAGTAEAATTSYQYDPATFGQTSITDADGKTTTNTYDSRGDLLSSTDPLGKTTKQTYDSEGDLLTSTDPLGVTTTRTYDGSGNLLSSSTPLSGGGTSKWSYTYGTGAQAGDRLSSTNPDGKTTGFAYDKAGDRTSSTDPLSNKATMSYDADGRLLTSTSPNGGTTTNVYNAAGELTKTTDPLGHSTSYSYDANGNRASSTDANGHTTTYAYDADNERTQTTRPGGSTVETGHDADGNIVSQTDGNGHTTSYSFTDLNQISSSTDPDGRTTKLTHDGVGNLLTSVNPAGQTTSYSHDADRRTTAIAYSDAATPGVHESYDADGRRVSLTDGTGTSTYVYDSLGRLTSQSNGAGATSSYTYDAAGNLTKITYPNGKAVTRAYDADNRLTESADWLANTTTFSYDGDGNLTAEHLPGAVTAKSAFDAADQLTSITDANSGGTLASFTYARDPVGELTSSAATGALSSTDSYSYDSQNRLTADNTASYAYDAGNNPTSFNGQPQRFDAADQLLASGSSGAGGEESGGGGGGGGAGGGGSPAPSPSGERGGSAGFHAISPPPVTVVSAARTHTASKRGKLSAGPLTTSSANTLLLAFVSAQGPKRGQKVRGIGGGGLRWSLVTEAASPQGTSSIWRARAPTPLAHATFTATLAKSGYGGMLDVLAFGLGATVGSAAKRSGARSTPSLALPASGVATILAVAHDSSVSRGRKAVGSGHVTDQALGGKRGGSSWTLSAQGGTGSVGLGGARSASWSMAAVAVLPAAAAAAARVTTARARAATPSAPSLTEPAPSRTPVRSSAAGGETTYTYNPQGDRTSVATPGATTTLTYDQANRLTAVGEDIHYSYDGDGLRMGKVVGGESTAFTWDESSGLPLLLEGGATSYVYGPSGQPTEQISGSTATYLLGDQQGSTRLLTSPAGTVVGTYSYDTWGSVTSHTGEGATNLQYDAQYTDPETGYQYLRTRYDDPATGVFLSRDPLVASTKEPYEYAADTPANAGDPTGMGAWAAIKKSAIENAADGYAQAGVDSLATWEAKQGPGPELFAGLAHGFMGADDVASGVGETFTGYVIVPIAAWDVDQEAQLAAQNDRPNVSAALSEAADWGRNTAGPTLQLTGEEDIRAGFNELGSAWSELSDSVPQLYDSAIQLYHSLRQSQKPPSTSTSGGYCPFTGAPLLPSAEPGA
jgi:RHS repeat-associated protein